MVRATLPGPVIRQRSLQTVLFFVAVLACTSATARAQGQSRVSPLVDFLSNTNTTYSYFWTALQAGHLDDYLNDTSLTLTVFAPTNDAWLRRLPTLTTRNGITVQQLFSESKSAALQSMLQYHILNTPRQASSFRDGDYLSTLSNLCSDAKTLSVQVQNSTITLIAAGGTRPRLLDRGLIVGNRTIVYPLDDVLLPSVVTIPLSVALANFNQTNSNPYSPTIAAKVSLLNQLQTETANAAMAPIYLQPATAPSGGRPPSPPLSTSSASGSSASTG